MDKKLIENNVQDPGVRKVCLSLSQAVLELTNHCIVMADLITSQGNEIKALQKALADSTKTTDNR